MTPVAHLGNLPFSTLYFPSTAAIVAGTGESQQLTSSGYVYGSEGKIRPLKEFAASGLEGLASGSITP